MLNLADVLVSPSVCVLGIGGEPKDKIYATVNIFIEWHGISTGIDVVGTIVLLQWISAFGIYDAKSESWCWGCFIDHLPNALNIIPAYSLLHVIFHTNAQCHFHGMLHFIYAPHSQRWTLWAHQLLPTATPHNIWPFVGKLTKVNVRKQTYRSKYITGYIWSSFVHCLIKVPLNKTRHFLVQMQWNGNRQWTQSILRILSKSDWFFRFCWRILFQVQKPKSSGWNVISEHVQHVFHLIVTQNYNEIQQTCSIIQMSRMTWFQFTWNCFKQCSTPNDCSSAWIWGSCH